LGSRYVAVASADDLSEGEARVFEVGGEWVALCKVKGGIYALEDRCTHDDGPLGEGSLDGFTIECPRHGARFDVRDGSIVCQPAYGPVRCFPVKVEDGQVFVEVSGEAT
jgi:3-phenylpropionate/trans-cinnamate dioxygenase ferredoxin subunit